MKIAIIGASYLQDPLIRKAKSLGLETHVFAWEVGDPGEYSADYFYPISIVEKEQILEKCKEIGIDGICTIASDLAVITVNYVANRMGLIGNSDECTFVSTNKNAMRQRFQECGDPSPKSILVRSVNDLKNIQLGYPVIVKPVDRSGSRGINLVSNSKQLQDAIDIAKAEGFEKMALVEEYITGQEYSAECISWMGNHELLAITKKYTTNAPNFIETAHLEPSGLNEIMIKAVKNVIYHALTSLGISNGASHSEFKIDNNGNIKIIEIGGRMGGDFIGSTLVFLSTGIDFLKAVIDVAIGNKPSIEKTVSRVAAVRFVLTQNDIDVLDCVKKNNMELLVEEDIEPITESKVTDSSTRFGYWIMESNRRSDIIQYLPENDHD